MRGGRREEIMTRTAAGDWRERERLLLGNTRPARRDGIIDEQTELVPVVVGEAAAPSLTFAGEKEKRKID